MDDEPTSLASMTPESLAEATKAFSESEYGQIFLGMLNTQLAGYSATAYQFAASAETKLAANERAAAISGILGFIEENIRYVEHPELLLDPEPLNPIDVSK